MSILLSTLGGALPVQIIFSGTTHPFGHVANIAPTSLVKGTSRVLRFDFGSVVSRRRQGVYLRSCMHSLGILSSLLDQDGISRPMGSASLKERT